MTDTTVRPLRLCDSCGGLDDHPRHVVGRGPDEPHPTPAKVQAIAVRNAGDDDALLEQVLAQIEDVSTVVKHMDCCRADGCPDGTCDRVTAGAQDLRGDDLVGHLLARPGEVLVDGVVVDADGYPSSTTTKEA